MYDSVSTADTHHSLVLVTSKLIKLFRKKKEIPLIPYSVNNKNRTLPLNYLYIEQLLAMYTIAYIKQHAHIYM